MIRWWRRLDFPLRISLLATVVGAIAIVPAYLSLTSASRSSDNAISEAALALIQSQRELNIRLEKAGQEVQRLKAEVEKIQKPTNQSKLAAQVAGMDAKVRQIDQEVSALQVAILRDPAKALEMPLLRRDIESNQVANQAALVAVRQDIDRQYDLTSFAQ